MTAIEPHFRPGTEAQWRRVKVRQVIAETSRVNSLLLEITGWEGHLPGQHLEVQLTAADGYQARRSYSIVSPVENEFISLTVERVDLPEDTGNE
jgi:ferredoxin-NADP reductase